MKGSCIFSGADKPRYIHIRAMGQNCTIGGATAVGTNISDFNITCLSSNMSFDLECYMYSNNRNNEKIVKRIEGNKHAATGTIMVRTMRFVSYSGIQANNSQSTS